CTFFSGLGVTAGSVAGGVAVGSASSFLVFRAGGASAAAGFLRAGAARLETGFEDSSESRCSMFFKPLRIDLGRFSAMGAREELCRAILLQRCGTRPLRG